MAINWTGFVSQLTLIHDSSNEYSTSHIAQEIEDAYVLAVASAQESTANNMFIVSTATTGLLKAGIESSLNSTVSIFEQVFDITDFDSGLTAFWLGSSFSPLTPAAGQSSVSNITVLSGGTGSTQLVPPPSESNVAWVNMLLSYFQDHASTISGTLTGTSSANGSPLIIPFSGVI